MGHADEDCIEGIGLRFEVGMPVARGLGVAGSDGHVRAAPSRRLVPRARAALDRDVDDSRVPAHCEKLDAGAVASGSIKLGRRRRPHSPRRHSHRGIAARHPAPATPARARARPAIHHTSIAPPHPSHDGRGRVGRAGRRVPKVQDRQASGRGAVPEVRDRRSSGTDAVPEIRDRRTSGTRPLRAPRRRLRAPRRPFATSRRRQRERRSTRRPARWDRSRRFEHFASSRRRERGARGGHDEPLAVARYAFSRRTSRVSRWSKAPRYFAGAIATRMPPCIASATYALPFASGTALRAPAAVWAVQTTVGWPASSKRTTVNRAALPAAT